MAIRKSVKAVRSDGAAASAADMAAETPTSQKTSQNFADGGGYGGQTAMSMDDYERETYRRSVAYGRARGQL